MSLETWYQIKQSKRFYVSTYHWVLNMLILSVCINLLIGFFIYYVYFHQHTVDFYATNGETPPIGLTPLDTPNYGTVALLPNDPDNEDIVKVIPE
jgi:intracellular multiplication protein IcmM